ncbi:MAG: hypothetical protein QOJ75_1146, partial [Chloroflexota bacterium]|nr:hypothetical protein [Chloroflexota bacterium]
MSAALLASLFTVIAASTALAAVTVTGVGNVPVGGTSTTTATVTLSEETAGCVTAALAGGTGHLYVQIHPKLTLPAAVTTTNYTRFTGTPVLTAPGSLAATVSLIDQSAIPGNNDTIDIRLAGSDPINKQQISVSGVSVKVGSNTDIGSIITTLNGSSAALATCFLATTTTASGTVSAAIGIGATSVNVAVSSAAPFAVTAGTAPGKLVFATGEQVTVTAAGAVVAGIQTLTISATTVVHAANEAVTQANVPAAAFVFPYAITSVGSVTDAVIQDVGTDTAAGGLPVGGAGALTVSPTSVN